MQQVLAKMVDTVAALLETFFGSQLVRARAGCRRTRCPG